MELICLGDSLTYGYGVRRAQCWTELAARESGWTLRNCGVCGDTTGGMLSRMRELLREEAALAIRLEATLEEFTSTIHCHPTVAEAVRECALAVDKKAIHIPNRK